MYIRVHVKYLLLLSDFNETWIFSTDFRKILEYQISWKSVEWARVVQGGRTDGQTDRHDKATLTFGNFANAPKNKTFIFV
jgi:hypothetical protein